MKYKHDLYDFTFLFSGRSYPVRDIEPELCGLTLNGQLAGIDEYEGEASLAKFSGYIYLPECGMPIRNWLDSISSDMAKFMCLFNDSGYPTAEVEMATFATDAGSYLFLTKLVVEPLKRGKGLGLIAALEAIKVWGRCADFVAINPFPLQFANGGDNDFAGQFDGVKYEAARAKLIAYYGRLGFSFIQPRGSDGVMVLSPKRNHPGIESIVENND